MSVIKLLHWNLRGLLNEIIKAPNASSNHLGAILVFSVDAKIPVKLEGNCFKQDQINFNCKNMVHVQMFMSWMRFYLVKVLILH